MLVCSHQEQIRTQTNTCLVVTTNAYTKIAEAQSAVVHIDRIEDIDAVVAEMLKLNKEIKTICDRCSPSLPNPLMILELDQNNTQKKHQSLQGKYKAEELVPFRLFLEEEGLQSQSNHRRKSNVSLLFRGKT